MSEPKWTPGPWEFYEMRPLSDGHYKWAEIGPHPNDPVAEIDADNGPNWKADGALMAAAPELYRALERLAERCDELLLVAVDQTNHVLISPELIDARAALAKARGERP